MESQRSSRRVRGLAPEREEYMDRCLFCLLVLTINSLTRNSIIHLNCCGKDVLATCQTRWLETSSRCAHCQAEQQQEEQPRNREPIVEIQREVVREALRAYARSDLAHMKRVEVSSFYNKLKSFIDS